MFARRLACERDGRQLFAELDLDIFPGDVLEIMGPNGAGKSTLLRILAGLLPDFTGTVDRRHDGEFLYLGHRTGMSPGLTGAENLRWFASLCNGGGAPASTIALALQRVGLLGYEDVPCQQLSAGQQRRAALARLLLSDAAVWLLDEPATALDDAGAELLRELIADHCRQGGAALLATHTRLGVDARLLRLGSSDALL